MTAVKYPQRPEVRELTIDGVQWRVLLVPEARAHTEAGLQYLAEFGYGCFVPLGRTMLDGTAESFEAVSEEGSPGGRGRRCSRGDVDVSSRGARGARGAASRQGSWRA